MSTKLYQNSIKLVREKKLQNFISLFGWPLHSGFIFNDSKTLTNLDMLAVFQQRMLAKGIMTTGINNFCLSMTDEDIERHISAIDEALNNVKLAIERGNVSGILKGKKISPIFKRN